jgi:hypothetical protein
MENIENAEKSIEELKERIAKLETNLLDEIQQRLSENDKFRAILKKQEEWCKQLLETYEEWQRREREWFKLFKFLENETKS